MSQRVKTSTPQPALTMEEKIDLILATQDTHVADLKEIKNDVKALKLDVSLLPQIEAQLKTVKDDITGVQYDVETNKDRITALETRIGKLADENNVLQAKLKQLESNKQSLDPSNLQTKLDEQLRKLNKRKQLIIEGIAEDQTTALETLVKQMLFDTGVKTNEQDIDLAFRVGVRSKNKPRSVLVPFVKQSTGDLIYRARHAIKNNPTCESIWTNEALDEVQRKERAELRALADLAKEEGLESKALGDTLVIQGIKYEHSTISKLPPNITLAKAYLKETEDSVYFQSEHSLPLSFG